METATMTAKKAGAMSGGRLAKVITHYGLELIFMRGSAQVVNVLEPEHYAQGSIKGSLLIPLSELDARCAELDKSKEVVTYSADASCAASRQAAELLSSRGFNAGSYVRGLKAWKEAGLPIEPASSGARMRRAPRHG